MRSLHFITCANLECANKKESNEMREVFLSQIWWRIIGFFLYAEEPKFCLTLVYMERMQIVLVTNCVNIRV